MEKARTRAAEAGPAGPLSLVVNGDTVSVQAATLAGLIAELGFGGGKIATAVNGAFVPERLRAATILSPGLQIEIVSARQGG